MQHARDHAPDGKVLTFGNHAVGIIGILGYQHRAAIALAQPLFLGGIVKDEGFSILTGAPAAPVAAIHDRAPVLIPTDQIHTWLDSELSGAKALQRCTTEIFGEGLTSWRVGDAAKNPRNEGAELIAAPRQASLF